VATDPAIPPTGPDLSSPCRCVPWNLQEDEIVSMTSIRILVPALALFAAACAPHHHPGMHGEHDRWAMHMGGRCEQGACTYSGSCFSNGAMRLNGGACQQCNAGQWVGTTGCSAEGCGMGKGCGMGHCRGGDGKPCGDEGMKHRRHGPPR